MDLKDFEYSGTSFNVGYGDGDPISFCYVDAYSQKHWFVLTNEKYLAEYSYPGFNYFGSHNLDNEDLDEYDIPESVRYLDSYFYVLYRDSNNNYGKVFKYYWTGYQTVYQEYYNISDVYKPVCICWDGISRWMVLGQMEPGSFGRIYLYTSSWVYNGGGYALFPSDESYPEGLCYAGNWTGWYWWMVGYDTDKVYKDYPFQYYGNYKKSYSIASEDTKPLDICGDGVDFYMLGGNNKRVYKYLLLATEIMISSDIDWKNVEALKINIGGIWKNVVDVKINVGGVWKDV